MAVRRRLRYSKRETYKGVRFRSKFEAAVVRALHAHGREADFEHVRLPYVVHKFYVTDLRLKKCDGSDMLIEAKGYFPPEDRRKMQAVRENHPDLDIRFVFQNATNQLNTKSKRGRTYGDWADQYGFPWCQGPELPESWIEELIISDLIDGDRDGEVDPEEFGA